MMRAAWQLVLCLVVAELSVCEAAAYAEECAKASDCPSKDASLCSIFWRDTTWRNNLVDNAVNAAKDPTAGTFRGFCVQCHSDCDCDVNQYCGIDKENPITIPVGIASSNPETKQAISLRTKKYIEVYGQAFAGMPIRSRCYNYELPEDVCNTGPVEDNQPYALPVQQTRMSDRLAEKVLRTPAWPPKDEEPRFCGRVASWGGAFLSYAVSGNQASTVAWSQFPDADVASTGNAYNSAARCPKKALYKDTALTCNACAECNPDGSFPYDAALRSPVCNASGAALFVPAQISAHEACQFRTFETSASPTATAYGFRFSSPAVEWEGKCRLGTCDICKEGDPDRCTAGIGIRQRCLNGQYVAVGDLNPTAFDYDVDKQTSLATSVASWLALATLFCILLTLCALCCRYWNKKRSEPREMYYDEEEEQLTPRTYQPPQEVGQNDFANETVVKYERVQHVSNVIQPMPVTEYHEMPTVQHVVPASSVQILPASQVAYPVSSDVQYAY